MKLKNLGTGICAAVALAGSVCFAAAKAPTAGELFIKEANIPNLVGVGVFASVDEINNAAQLFLTQLNVPMATMMGEASALKLKTAVEEYLGKGRPNEPILALAFIKENKASKANEPWNPEPSFAILYPTTITAAEFPAKFGNEVEVVKKGKEFKVNGNDDFVVYTANGRYAAHGDTLWAARATASAKCFTPASCKKFLGGNVAAFAITPYGLSLAKKGLDTISSEAAGPDGDPSTMELIKYIKDMVSLFKAGYASFGIDSNGIIINYGYIPAKGISIAGDKPVPEAVLKKLPASTLWFVSESIGGFEKKLYSQALNFIKKNQSFALLPDARPDDSALNEISSLLLDLYIFGYNQIINSDYYATAMWIDENGRFGGNSIIAGKSAAQHSAKAAKLANRFEAFTKKHFPALKIDQFGKSGKHEVKAESVKAAIIPLIKKFMGDEAVDQEMDKDINVVIDRIMGSKLTVSSQTKGNIHETVMTLGGAARPAPNAKQGSLSTRIKAIIPEIEKKSLTPDSYVFASFSDILREVSRTITDIVKLTGEENDPDFVQFKRVTSQLPAKDPAAGIASASFTSKGAKNTIVRISAQEIQFFGKLVNAIMTEAMASAMQAE